ncbi:MAG TPA: HNH endonuclease signature motif containing protein [Chloroflexota bacterium]|nr:HNH endonuclease signature motif containing protein [Chloroflexota bacterium]
MVQIKRIAEAEAAALEFAHPGRQRLDLAGQRFGMLSVLDYAGQTKPGGTTLWRCRCDCGNERVLIGSELTRTVRPRKSCGCLVRTNAIGKPSRHRVDISGQRFGRLIAIEFAQRTNGSSQWRCRCDCGSTKIVSLGNLRKGRVQSCGCLQREVAPRHAFRVTQGLAIERFWRSIVCDLTSECWIWVGPVFSTGYGRIYIGGTNVQAHRFAYQLLVGPLDPRLVIDHLCNVRSCVRPDHLEQKTSLENYLRSRHCPTCMCNSRVLGAHAVTNG